MAACDFIFRLLVAMTKMVIFQLGSLRLLVFIMAQAGAECILFPTGHTFKIHFPFTLGSLLMPECEI